MLGSASEFHLPISRKIIIVAFLIIFAWTMAEVSTRTGWLDTLDHIYYDLWNILAGLRTEPKYVAIVVIDNETLLNYRDEPLIFWGPHFAKGIEVLRRVGVRMIGLDYLFSISAESWLKKLEVPGSERSRTFDIPMRAQLATGKVVPIGWVTSNDKGESELLLPMRDYLFALPNGTQMLVWPIFTLMTMVWYVNSFHPFSMMAQCRTLLSQLS